MRSGTQSRGARFPVAEVTPCTVRLPEVNLRTMLEKQVQSTLLVCPGVEHRIVDSGGFHPLIAAAALAFKQHYPLALSPDILWLTILQGVAQHVANHAESLRPRLSLHATKIELIVDTNLPGLPTTDAEMLATTRAFVDLVRKHSPPDKHFLLETEFSTTTDVERIVGAVVLMDTFQPYFDYIFACICGIPFVTLEGTAEDWERLAAKVRLLHDSDLELAWWTKHLLPLCDHFVRASRGDVDREHWKNLFKLVERYGFEDLNGWLLKFIPYISKNKNEPSVHRNPVLELTTYENLKPTGRFELTGCTAGMLPTGISQVPTTCLNRSTGKTKPFQFLAGFIGVSQSAEDHGIKPALGWAIAKPMTIDSLIEEVRLVHDGTPQEKIDGKVIVETMDGNIAGDMWKFYCEIKDATIQFPIPNEHGDSECEILDFRSIKPVLDNKSIRGELLALRDLGHISAQLAKERGDFMFHLSSLQEFAVPGGKQRGHYVFGHMPDTDARFFRWNGKHDPSGLVPLAKTFTEWLKMILDWAKLVK